MTQYVVHSGPLTIVISAETAYDAAIEALQWWGDSPVIEVGKNHRLCLDAELTVCRSGSNRKGARFATYELIALARGEEPKMAWRRLLGNLLENPN